MQELEDLREKVSALLDSFQTFVAVFDNHMDSMTEMSRELERLRREQGEDYGEN